MADNQTTPDGMTVEKLYSPLFVQMYSDEDRAEGFDDIRKLSQKAAAKYKEPIHDAILRERLQDEKSRGLMAYYYDGGAIEEKVHSLYVDVEEIDGRLWGVATLELKEELFSDELVALEDYLTGQYSDGFGESFEQRWIRVSDGEVLVSLWQPGQEFFIATERELEERLGIILDSEKILTPEARLRERLKENLAEYRENMLELSKEELFHRAAEVSCTLQSYAYLTNEHRFTAAEVDFMLKFEDPLNVVADRSDDQRLDIGEMVDVIFRDKAWTLRQGGYALMPEDETPIAAELSSRQAIEKPSVMEQIRRAREDAKHNPAPHKDNPSKDRAQEI